MMNNPQLWQGPLISDRDFMETDAYKKNIIDPAVRALKENMMRAPLSELCDVSKPSSKTIEDMGDLPWRFRGSEQIFPFRTKTDKDDLICEVNPDYQSKDLVQISQRLKHGRSFPEFSVTRKDIEEQGAWKSLLCVTMCGFLKSDWRFEVVRVS